MTSLTGDIINRVRRLPKPSSSAEALQPVFEAVSNAMHAIQDRADIEDRASGNIEIVIQPETESNPTEISVSDNGVGLDDERFKAFITTDTAYKIGRGGKGVGRLLWLDAFDFIHVDSVFQDGTERKRRSFDFVLEQDDQIQEESLVTVDPSTPLGTTIKFRGVRGTAYGSRFPVRPKVIIRHFGSHFLAEFIMGNSPSLSVTAGEHHAQFPEAIRDMLIEERGVSTLEHADFGELSIHHFAFKAMASAGFEGNHQLHFVANGRTVLTRKIDGLVGVGKIGEDSNGVYHGCVVGPFLDDRVNQERTHFNIDEKVIEELSKACAQAAMEDALNREVAEFDEKRLETMGEFLSEYPSFHWADPSDLLKGAPKSAVKAEQFAQALIPTRIRRDQERNRRVQKIVSAMADGAEVSDDFAAMIRTAADDVRAEEQRQLTEYVLRRRVVLDVLDVLVRRMREVEDGKNSFHLESTLHQFICPMQLRGDDPTKVEASGHDLWIIDERLAFANYFASDVPISKILSEGGSAERPDLFIWDKLHGLGAEGEDPLKRVMLVEFKRPGRSDYDERYTPENQIARYLKSLRNGEVENYRNERVRVEDDCIFTCFVVADIVGTLETYTDLWKSTADGRGRWTELSGKYRGTIEVIEWRDLLSDARTRNRAFLELAR